MSEQWFEGLVLTHVGVVIVLTGCVAQLVKTWRAD